MMQIVLSDEEANLLTAVASQYLSDLREEIYKTETFEVKDQLKREEALLKGILGRFGSA
ncbi:MAG TPA: hypothetical protein VKJ45_13990 [Blastocatellia bacterium]|jgi:hypothetical protein|nr:hypothetical protein [Blastocatellia bacterium]